LWRLDAVVQPETRAVFRRLLDQGWIDATRHLHPDERIYTFWVNDAAFRRNAGFRMDFLLLTPNLATRLVDTALDSAERGWENLPGLRRLADAQLAGDPCHQRLQGRDLAVEPRDLRLESCDLPKGRRLF